MTDEEKSLVVANEYRMARLLVLILCVGAMVEMALLLAGVGIRTASAHEPSECPPALSLPAVLPPPAVVACPPCPETDPSPEQVQAVQRALDAIEAVEAMEAALPVMEQGPGQVVPPPVLEAPLAP